MAGDHTAYVYVGTTNELNSDPPNGPFLPIKAAADGTIYAALAAPDESGFPTAIQSVAVNPNGIGQIGYAGLGVFTPFFGFTGGSYVAGRVATTYRSMDFTNLGNNQVWLPASGTRFRLMGYTLSVCGTLSATGRLALNFLDGDMNIIFRHNAGLATGTVGGDTQITVDLGQGYLSTDINNALNLSLSDNVSNGSVAVNVWGTEE